MMLLDLDTATSEILQACDEAKATGRRPFVFVVGAGISYPSIPLAGGIVEHCKTVSTKYKRTIEPTSIEPIDIYSHWFQQAYPNARQRQQYLRSLIEGRPISPANLRLAHLLLDKKIANTVLTPNFDDFISRALTLFGRQHIVCDHPGTAERIDPEHDDIQIVHVHGSYWFYDCCNLRNEIETRAYSSSRSVVTMASLLDDILAWRSPIVIGYAGWDGDVIMTALKRRLKRPLPYNVYWFCHRRTDANLLPVELTGHQQVRIVVPSEMAGIQGVSRHRIEEDADQREGFAAAEESSLESAQSAQQVVEKLIRELDLDAPELTRDPLGFFARSLRIGLLQEPRDEVGEDIYSLREVVARIELANELEADGRGRGGTVGKRRRAKVRGPFSRELERIRDALRRSNYREAIATSTEIPKEGLGAPQLQELMRGMWVAALGLLDNSVEELAGYDEVLAIADVMSKKGAGDGEIPERVSEALINKGITLVALGRGGEAVAVYDDVVRRFGEAKEPVVQEQVGRALINKGTALGALGRSEEAIAVYDDVVRRFGEAKEPELQEQVGRALVNKGSRLSVLNRRQEAIAVYDDVVRRLGEAKEPTLHELANSAQEGIRELRERE